DAALRELLGRFPDIEGIDLARPLADQLTERLDEAVAESGADITWNDDVAPWFDGTIALAVTDVQPASAAPDPSQPFGSQGILLLIGVTDPAAATAAAERILAMSPAASEVTESQPGGVTIREVAGSGAYAVTDDQLVFAMTADDVGKALDARSSGSNLADSAEFAELTASLPADWLVWGVYDMSRMLATALTGSGAASPEMTAAFEQLLAYQPMRGAFAVSASGDSIVMDGASDLPTGPFAVTNADRGLADEIPGDALFYSEGGNIGPALAAVIEPLKAAFAADPMMGQQLETMEAALGAELEDLFSWIGDGAMALGWDGTQPYAGMVIIPNDMAAAQRRLGQLATFARLAASDTASGIAVEESIVGTVKITTIRWEGPAPAAPDPMMPTPTGVAVEFVITDERVLIGIGDGFVTRALELDSADSLAETPRYTDSVAELGGANNAGVMWLDLAGTREAVETAMAPMLEMMDTSGMYESDIRPWLMPLDRVVAVSRVDGDRLVQKGVLLFE
ncbi:MAG: DUF3352 domain-containing protein, partial [Candidatus Limnocylindria bacterium]